MLGKTLVGSEFHLFGFGGAVHSSGAHLDAASPGAVSQTIASSHLANSCLVILSNVLLGVAPLNIVLQ
jgi:hypothetical protein